MHRWDIEECILLNGGKLAGDDSASFLFPEIQMLTSNIKLIVL